MKKFTVLLASVAVAASAAAQAPETLYMVGAMNGWATPDQNENRDAFALKSANNDGIYTGEFDVEASELKFKLFDAVAGWNDTDHYFSCVEGEFTIFSSEPTVVNIGASDGADFACANWVGGKVSIVVNWETKTVALTGPDQPAEDTMPEKVYLVGAMNGWDVNNADYALEKESYGRYAATFNIPADQLQFKLFTVLGGWVAGNYFGAAVSDFTLRNGQRQQVFMGGSNDADFKCLNWTGGDVTITVSLIDRYVEFYSTDIIDEGPEVIYLVGKPQGWDINSSTMVLEKDEATGTFRGSYEIADTDAQFRFYTQLGNWDECSLGLLVEDQSTDVELTDGTYSSDMVWGKGCWTFTNWAGGKMYFDVDVTRMKMTVSDKEIGAGVDDINSSAVVSSRYFDLNGAAVANPGKGIYVKVSKLSDGTTKTVKVVK